VILLACAVEKELSLWPRTEGVELLLTGIGPVEAACAVTRALETRTYSLVVNAGLGGAFDGAATIGDGVAIVDDVMELGLEDGRPLALPPGECVIDKAHSDASLIAALQAQGFKALHGVTVARVTSTEESAQRMLRLGANVESMEGFAVLRAAARAGVRAVELRGISNRAGDRERSGWSFDDGARGLARILTACLAL
jgi:futalosine hydrolase